MVENQGFGQKSKFRFRQKSYPQHKTNYFKFCSKMLEIKDLILIFCLNKKNFKEFCRTFNFCFKFQGIFKIKFKNQEHTGYVNFSELFFGLTFF